MVKLLILVFILQLGYARSQDCHAHYRKIHDLQSESHHIFYDTTMSMSKKIRLSKRLANEALEHGYSINDLKRCSEYSILVDRMIELEMQFRHNDEAEKLALERLDSKYPGWKDPDKIQVMEPEDLSVLHWIHSSRGSRDFYYNTRKNKGLLGGCGLIDNVEQITLDNSRILQMQYGNIFGFRFLQNSKLDINIVDERMVPVWTEIYDALIDMWLVYEDIDSIVTAYESAQIKETSPEMVLIFQAKQYIQVSDVPFFFHPKSQIINKRSQSIYPANPEEVKANSLLYKRLLYRKSASGRNE